MRLPWKGAFRFIHIVRYTHSFRSIHMLISFDVNVCIERDEMTNEAV